MRPVTEKIPEVSPGNELAARFSVPLLNYFRRRVRDRMQAEDLVQDVLLRVIRVSEREAIEHSERLVFKVAGNLLKDVRRRTKRQPELVCHTFEEAGEDTDEALIDARSPERVLVGEISLTQVLQALGELSELTRNVFILFRLEHMKQKDIAALYGLAQSTVEKHVMKAVRHLASRCTQI